jgi:GT2 family glycosyltransferase
MQAKDDMPGAMELANGKMPRVSILIANYNGIGVLSDCIESVLMQNFKSSIEIIIHDDASTDGSAAYIRDCFPQVRLIESTDNVGFCISNNRLADAAQGEFLLLLNNDAMLLPEALQSLFDYAVDSSLPAILTLPQYDAETGRLIDAGSFLDPFLNPVPNRALFTQEVGMAIGACLWIPKSLWKTLGGFPEWFGSIGEDLYLCCLARLWGFPVRSLGISGFRHIVGRSLGGGKLTQGRLSTTRRRRALSELNKSYVMILTFPAALLWLIFPLHQLLLMLEGIVIAIAKRDITIWKTIYAPIIPAVWKARDKLLSQRRNIQRGRRIGLKQWLTVFTSTPHKLNMWLKYGFPEIK